VNSTALPVAHRPLLTLQELGSIALLTVCYFALAQLGYTLVPSSGHATAIWPPAGLSLAAILLVGPRVWPGVFIGGFVAAYLHSGIPIGAACLAAASTLAALFGALLLHRLRFDAAFERNRDVVYLMVVSVVSTLIIPCVGPVSLALYGHIPWSSLASTWWQWWAADCLGILMVTPLLLTWVRRPRQPMTRSRLMSFLGFLAVVLMVSRIASEIPFNPLEPRYLLLSTAFPLLVWAAVQFGPRETILAAVILSAAAAWTWIHGRIPNPVGVLDRPLLVIDVFIAEIICTGLLLGSITVQRRRAYDEMEQRVTERTAELASRNAEKELLLKEIHHRVKNNMQVICSLLNLQARRFDDTRLVQAFHDSQFRVKSMALVHEHLYQSRDLDRISMNTYVRALVEGIASTQLDGQKVRCEVEAGNITLPIDAAVPCGLIINEMVTNAFKHAFPDGNRGRLSIFMTERPVDRVEIVVSDDGIGLPPGARSAPTLSFGMNLVSMLVEQLNATLEVLPTPGTAFKLTFARSMPGAEA
jgi:two-component sensor histidine kinase/integral membrane sensor domain MASE1